MQAVTMHEVKSEEPRNEVMSQEQHEEASPPVRWRLATRILFRFTFSYLALYWISLVSTPWWGGLVAWTGVHVFHADRLTFVPTGSGDSSYEYVVSFCVLTFAVASTAIWSALDRRRTNYHRMQQWFHALLRMGVAACLLMYGAFKVIPSQMPSPSPSTLLETYGQPTPMHLLWTFMGASHPYEIFAGSTEMLAGLLLLFPGLATLGALIAMTVMSNVFLLNMCYDVPVKIFSSHLLLMAVVLAAPDIGSLANYFVFGRRAQLSKSQPLFRRRWTKHTMLVVKLVFCAVIIVGPLWISYSAYSLFRDVSKAKTFGIWSVEEFKVDGKTVPSSASAAGRWKQVTWVIPFKLTLDVDGRHQVYLLKPDRSNLIFELRGTDSASWVGKFTYQNPQPDLMVFSGDLGGKHIEARMRRVEVPASFPLTSRGFHWINESPNNQ